MKLRIEHGLLFGQATLLYRDRQLILRNVLLDTGSAGTLFSIDSLANIGVQFEPEDRVHRIRGVGGSEFVFTKRLNTLSHGELRLQDFEVEIGAMNYGMPIDGIVGLDFLLRVNALLDLNKLELNAAL